MLGPIANFIWRILSLVSFLIGAGCMIYAISYFGGFLKISEDVRYAISSQNFATVSAHLANARLVQATTGVFVGLSFAFFGAGMVLQGVASGDEKLEGDARARLAFSRTLPGAIVFLCAAVLIAWCTASGATSVHLPETQAAGQP